VAKNQFIFLLTTEPFYATALHELGHWTGHPSRLNRDMSGSFGDSSYGREELVAELSSAFCCAALGFSKTISNNAAYIQNWLGILKQDNRVVVKAASEAQKAADYILAFRQN
jgi:antirestriction protein ArdC